MVQSGAAAPQLRKVKTRSKVAGTPTKPRKIVTSTPLSSTSRIDLVKSVLPGKRSMSNKKTSKKFKNKCEICSVIYGSLEDNLGKKFKGRQNQWIGCDTENCDYWVHARCINMKCMVKLRTLPLGVLITRRKYERMLYG